MYNFVPWQLVCTIAVICKFPHSIMINSWSILANPIHVRTYSFFYPMIFNDFQSLQSSLINSHLHRHSHLPSMSNMCITLMLCICDCCDCWICCIWFIVIIVIIVVNIQIQSATDIILISCWYSHIKINIMYNDHMIIWYIYIYCYWTPAVGEETSKPNQMSYLGLRLQFFN